MAHAVPPVRRSAMRASVSLLDFRVPVSAYKAEMIHCFGLPCGSGVSLGPKRVAPSLIHLAHLGRLNSDEHASSWYLSGP